MHSVEKISMSKQTEKKTYLSESNKWSENYIQQKYFTRMVNKINDEEVPYTRSISSSNSTSILLETWSKLLQFHWVKLWDTEYPHQTVELSHKINAKLHIFLLQLTM
jgi:hypothetical protein